MVTRYDALICSDWHLSSDACQRKHIKQFLVDMRVGKIQTQRLILNGDVLDSINLNELSTDDAKILLLLRGIGATISHVVWVYGNHEEPITKLQSIVKWHLTPLVSIKSGGKRILCMHGHMFDPFISEHPILTYLADTIYRMVQRLDYTHMLSNKLKHGSKNMINCSNNVYRNAIAEAMSSHYCDIICCGHTHMPAQGRFNGIEYYNSGSWVDKPCTLLSVKDGKVAFHTYTLSHPKGSNCGLSEPLTIDQIGGIDHER